MTTSRPQIVVADDEQNLRRVISAQLERMGCEAHGVADGAEVLRLLGEQHVDLVITDLRMPKIDGMTLLRILSEEYPDVPVIMMTAHGTVDTAVEALRLGAFDYVTKPFDRDELRLAITKALQIRARDPDRALRSNKEGDRFHLVGESAAMRQVYSVIERVAATPSTVLITGESGTGKELVARALHENSKRASEAFIRVNCAAIPPELIESELFGHEKGAFTGATSSKPGRFELAHRGSIFLDEIGEVSPAMQVKLLRVLQEQEFDRVGGVRTTKVDVRLIAATNRDLQVEIREGRFREDLYYRLNVVHLELPPLRERPTDIPLLVGHFLQSFNAKLDRQIEGVRPDAMELLMRHAWRGNVRELENVVERCMLFCDGRTIQPSHLPASVKPSEPPQAAGLDMSIDAVKELGLKGIMKKLTEQAERTLILRALEHTDSNVTHAARVLQISRKGLQTKMKELGLRDSSDADDETAS